MVKMEGVAWLHGAAPEMESRGRGMEIDTDSGLARSALTMWRRRTLHPDHIHTGDKKRGGDTYADCSWCSHVVDEEIHVLGCMCRSFFKSPQLPVMHSTINFNTSQQHEDLCQFKVGLIDFTIQQRLHCPAADNDARREMSFHLE